MTDTMARHVAQESARALPTALANCLAALSPFTSRDQAKLTLNQIRVAYWGRLQTAWVTGRFGDIGFQMIAAQINQQIDARMKASEEDLE